MAKSKLSIIVLVIIIAGAIFTYYGINRSSFRPDSSTIDNRMLINSIPKNMKIESTVFQSNENIPSRYSCDGEGINPPLTISSVREDAKSLTLIMDDPDAPVPGGFVHWVVFNLNPKTGELQENSAPKSSIEGTNGAGKNGYVGPCPPSGTHRYFFKLYALDTVLALNSSAKRENVEKAMEGHILEQSDLIGLYQRQ